MAKDGKKKADGATGKTGRIPKRIAGFKVPKDLRKSGDALLEKVSSPGGRQAIASGLAMVASVAASAAANKRSTAERPASPDAKPDRDEAQKMADALGVAAEAMMKRVFGG